MVNLEALLEDGLIVFKYTGLLCIPCTSFCPLALVDSTEIRIISSIPSGKAMVTPEIGVETKTEFLISIACEQNEEEDQEFTFVTGPLVQGEWDRIGEPGPESEINIGILPAGMEMEAEFIFPAQAQTSEALLWKC